MPRHVLMMPNAPHETLMACVKICTAPVPTVPGRSCLELVKIVCSFLPFRYAIERYRTIFENELHTGKKIKYKKDDEKKINK